MSIHDFDLIRWLTGSEVKELWATGGCYEFKQYKDWDDGDNVSGLMKMETMLWHSSLPTAQQHTALMLRPKSLVPAARCVSLPFRPTLS